MPRSLLRRTLALLGLALVAPPGAAAAPAHTLRVFAAASLTDAFQDLARAYERDHAGVRVQLQFAGSQILARQLEQGARADVFASADPAWLAGLERDGRLDGPWVVFAHNPLVVIAPAHDPGRLGGPRGLSRPRLKLVLAAPSVPAGRYARALLRALGRQPGFGRGFTDSALANVVSDEDDVRAVLEKVRLGEADAGIVYASDVAGIPPRELRVWSVPEGARVTADDAIGVLHGPEVDLAHAFVDAVCSPAGQRALRARGFSPARTPAALPR
ncbi:MAG TPA: molybdate ABC transporter substrate-binding protein [Candidatus Eisenbacteria bacterium]